MENPYQAPSARLEQSVTSPDIDSLDISETWKRRFRLIEQAGPYVKGNYRNIKSLAPKERRAIGFNTLAFIFSIIYYFAKGMPKKALALLGISWLFAAAITITEVVFQFSAPNTLFWIPVSAIAGVLANQDYYQKVVKGQDMWLSLNILKAWPVIILFTILSFTALAAVVVWQYNTVF